MNGVLALARSLFAKQAGNDVEVEQTKIRMALVGAISLYLYGVALGDGVLDPHEVVTSWIVVGYVIASVVLFAMARIRSGNPVARRLVGMALDISGATLVLMRVGDAGTVVFSVYLWVTFGNGFRYGKSYLYASQLASLAGFGFVVMFSEIWNTQRTLAVGLFIGLAILPLYVASLLQRITDALRRAEQANEAKSRFVSNMSHELRTPLNGIIGMNDMLRDSQLTEEQREFATTIGSSASMMLTLVEEVLDLSRIEAGKLAITETPFDLHRLVRSVAQLVRFQANGKGLTLYYHISSDAPFQLVGDDGHLRQVLVNLLGNAIKFTESGEVRLNVGVVRSEPERVWLRFDVVDTGIGIAPEHHQRIFERFIQADESTTRRFGGTGLGVTICKQLVEAMGGRIGVISQLGHGSTFWFELPMTRQKLEPAAGTPLSGAHVVAVCGTEVPGFANVQAALARGGARIERAGRLADAVRMLLANDDPGSKRAVVLCASGETREAIESFPAALRSGVGSELPVVLIQCGANPVDHVRLLTSGYAYAFAAPVAEELIINALHACLADPDESFADADEPGFDRRALGAIGKGISVLVADDNATNRKVTRMILERSGFSVQVVDNGDAALSRLGERHFDVAVIDMHMPGMPGDEVARAHKFTTPAGRRAKIVMLSADVTPGAREACLAAGADAYLTKPIDRVGLLRTISRLAGRGTPPRAAMTRAAGPAPAGEPPAKVIDEALLSEQAALSAGGQFLSDLVRGFAEDSRGLLDRLRACDGPGSVGTTRDVVHALKGSAGNIGAARLFHLCEAILALPDTQIEAARIQHIEALERDFGLARAALTEFVQRNYTR